MNNPSILIYTLVMAGVTYLLRAAPILIFQKKIENPFIRLLFFTSFSYVLLRLKPRLAVPSSAPTDIRRWRSMLS